MQLNLFEPRTTDPTPKELKKAKKEEQKRKHLEEKIRNEEKNAALQNMTGRDNSRI